jgi:serine/threonine protein kinase
MVVGHHPWSIGSMAKLVKQVVAGHFTIPPTVTPLCADLITRLLKVNPAERLKMDQIFSHGWVVAGKTRTGRAPVLPPLFPVSRSFDEMRVLQRRRATFSEVVSPFDFASDSEVSEPARLPPAEAQSGRTPKRRAFAASVRSPLAPGSRDGVRSPRLSRVHRNGLVLSRGKIEESTMFQHTE